MRRAELARPEQARPRDRAEPADGPPEAQKAVRARPVAQPEDRAAVRR